MAPPVASLADIGTDFTARPASRKTRGPFAGFAAFWRDFANAAFNPYRPEDHYMRGPGPAWHAKHGINFEH